MKFSRHIRPSTLEKNLILFSSTSHMLLFRLTNNEKSQSGSENCSTSGHMSVFDMRLHHLYTHQFNTKINQPLVRKQKQECEISDVTIPLILTQYSVKCFTGVEKGDKYIRNGNCLLAVNTCSSCCVHVKNLPKKYSILQVGSGDI